MKYLYLIISAIFLVCLFTFSISKKDMANEKIIVANNDSIPFFLQEHEYENADGSMFSFNQVKGKVLLLDFWATWCGPCIREHPSVVALEKNINSQNFEVVTVSVDKDKLKWQDFIAEKKWPGIHIKINKSDINNPLNQMVIKKVFHNGDTLYQTSVPQYYIVGKDLSIEKIKDIKAESTIVLIKKRLYE